MAVRWLFKQHRFNGGAVDPQLYGRDDTELYYAAAQAIKNMLVMPTGAAVKRPGLVFVAEIPEAAAGVRLAAFTFSATERYLFVILDELVRVFYADTAQADIVSPWTGSQLREINWTQQADTFLGFHPAHRYRRIQRQGSHTAWAIDDLPLRNVPTYHFGATTAGTATPTGKTGPITIDSTAADFAGAQVGHEVAINAGTARITNPVSSTQVNARVLQDLLDTDAAAAGTWFVQEPQWSDTRGWPATGRFHRNRLAVAGGSRPTNVALSTARDFFDFDTGAAADDDAVIFDLLSDSIDDIRQMHSVNDRLLLLTSQGEWALTADTITPKTPGATVFTQLGSANIRPVQIEEGVFFVGNADLGRHSLFEAAWSALAEGYSTEDVSQLAGHLIADPVDLAGRKGDGVNAANHLFVVNTDGTVAVLNTLRKQKVTGWSQLVTDGQILAVATLGPTTYFVVRRTIAAVARYFVEKLDNDSRLDSSVTATASPAASVFSGFDHLDGHTVKVRSGGLVFPDATVAAGQVTTPYDVESVEAGLGFDWELETLPIPDRALAEMNGKDKVRIVQVEIDVLAASGVNVDGVPIPTRRLGDTLLDQDIPQASGPVSVRRLGWSRQPTVRIHGDQPTPVTIRSLRVEVAV
jgi:hypothetical protein